MMKRLPLATVLGLLLGLCACSSDEPCFVDPISTPVSPIGLLVAGEPVDMNISPFESGGCSPVGIRPESLTTEVSGPDQQPVPSEGSMNYPSQGWGSLRFTPEKPGRYHILTVFEPVGGLQQFDLHAARDRSAEAPVLNLESACTSLQRTDRGTWVCNSQVFWPDRSSFNLPSGKVSVIGNVVWVAGELQLHRYVDTGTRLEPTGTLSHSEGPAEFLLATQDELLVLYPRSLRRIAFNGTALVPKGGALWEGTNTPLTGAGPQGVLLRTGNRLALVSRAPSPGGLGNWACTYQIDAELLLRTSEPCQNIPGRVMGYEPSVLWVAEISPLMGLVDQLHRMEWTGSQLETRGSLLIGASLELISLSTQGPTSVPVFGASFELRGLPLRAGVPVYQPEQRQLLLETLDKEIARPQASSTLLWGAGPTGRGARIRLRPSTP